MSHIENERGCDVWFTTTTSKNLDLWFTVMKRGLVSYNHNWVSGFLGFDLVFNRTKPNIIRFIWFHFEKCWKSNKIKLM